MTNKTNDQTNSDPILSKLHFIEKEDLLRMLNGAYIAERFFGRSACWFSQKLNQHIKNGKPCDFTPEERETLKNAIYTISLELQDFADEL